MKAALLFARRQYPGRRPVCQHPRPSGYRTDRCVSPCVAAESLTYRCCIYFRSVTPSAW